MKYRGLKITIALIGALSAGLLHQATGQAHDKAQERGILAQIAPDRVEIMLTYYRPAGDQVDLLKARYDLNKNGKIDKSEAPLAGQVWLKPALAGLQFEVVGEAPKAHSPEIKFREEEDGGLSMAALVRYDLPKLATDKARTFRVSLDPGAAATAVHLQSIDGLKLVKVGERVLEKPREHSGPYALESKKPLTATFGYIGETEKNLD
jgi:hypothetical protein